MSCKIQVKVGNSEINFDNYQDLLVYIKENMQTLWGQYFSPRNTGGVAPPIIRYRIADTGLQQMEDALKGKLVDSTSTETNTYESDGHSGEDSVTTAHKKLPDGVSVTKLISTKFDYNGETKCLKGKVFDKNWYRTRLQDLGVVNIDDEVRKHEDLLRYKGDVGTYIHQCIETEINGEEMPDTVRISDSVKTSIQQQVVQFVKHLKKIHGDSATFEVEYPVVSKQISSNFKAWIGGDKQSVYGFVDLLVKDSSGQIHLYDFKTSENSFDRMSSYTKHGYAAQLAVYAQMLRQWGVNLPDANIHVVPINTEYKVGSDGNPITDLENATFWFPKGNRDSWPSLSLLWHRNLKDMVITKINAWIPLVVNTSTKVLDENVTQLLRQIFPPELLQEGSVAEVNQSGKVNVTSVRENLFTIRPDSSDYQLGYRKKLKLNRYVDSSELERYGQVYNSFLYISEGQEEEAIKAYVTLYNEAKKTNIANQGKELQEVANSSSVEVLDDYINSLSGSDRQNWARVQLLPYIKNGWKIVSNENLLENGIVIFSKTNAETKRPEYDIIMLSNKSLHTQYDFAKSIATHRKATSVAGTFFYDDEGIDNKNVLTAEYGNMLLMKAMAYITSNSEFFKQGTIRSVKAWNMDRGEETYAGNTMLQRSWTTIMRGMHNKGVPEFDTEGNIVRDSSKNIIRHTQQIKGLASHYVENGETKYIFQPDSKAMLEMAIDMLTESNHENRLRNLDNVETTGKTIEEITESQIMALLRSYTARGGRYKGEISNPTEVSYDEDSVAKHYVLSAWLALKGRYLTWEKDMDWVSKEINAPAMNKSVNARVTNDIMASYMNTLRRDYAKTAKVWRKKLLAAYEEMHMNIDTMNESKFFREYFVKDPNKYMLYSLAEFANKYGENSKMYELMEFFQKRDGDEGVEYDEHIPLVKGGSLERMYQQGIVKKYWEDAKEIVKLFKAPIEDEFDHPDYMVLDSDDDTREEALSSHEPGYYSMNLDYVFLHNLQQKKRKYWQIQYDPIFAAVRNCINYMDKFQGGFKSRGEEGRLSNTAQWIDEYIRAKYENKTLVDKSLRPWMHLIDKITGLASGIQLWFNTRAMFREMWTSLSIGITRALTGEYPTITESIYKQALQEIVGSENKLDLDGELYQQNIYFGMANVDVSGLAEACKTGRWNFWNLTGRAPYITSSLPDLYYRNTILRAKMIADGVSKAYYCDEDGTYGYHFDKDTRFNLLSTGGKNLSEEQKKEYFKQVTLYNHIVDDLNTRRELYGQDGVIPPMLKHINVGDTDVAALWDAYTQAELQGIRNYSDKLYGHYNDENRMMLQERFIGHYVMQYRTYISARLEQNFQGSHATNIVHYRFHTDSNEEQLYKVMNSDGTYVLKPESEVTEDEKANGLVVIAAEDIGMSQTGQITNVLNMTKALIHFKKNPEDFREWWANPLHRQLLTLFLIDNFVTALLLMLLNWVVGNKVKPKYQPIKSGPWWDRWSYGVLAGSFQDGPIWNLIGQMNSLDPPVINQLSNWYSDVAAVMTGKDNIAHAIVENFGMTREFSSLFELDNFNL